MPSAAGGGGCASWCCSASSSVGAGGGAYWWLHRPLPLPAGIAYGNGRIEADPIDIATKFAGRIAELRVDEGDMVTAGQVVAVMDTRDMAASLKKSEAQVEQARKAIQEANANVDQTHTQVVLADQEIERARALLKNGFITKELFDQRQQRPTARVPANLPPRQESAWPRTFSMRRNTMSNSTR